MRLGACANRGRRRAAGGAPVGRPHLARAVWDHPGNRDRLEAERLTDAGAVLEAYLVPGAPAYRRRTTPTVQEAIGAIHDAGGLAVWAHPFWDLDEDPAVLDAVDRFASMGLDGVECFYVTPHGGPDAAGHRSLRAARAAHDGLGRLPRPGASPVQRVPRVRHVRLDPRLGAIAEP